MKWNVEFTTSSRAELKELRNPLLRRVVQKIANLEANPFPSGCQKLEHYEKTYRIHVAKDWRIVYYVDFSARTVIITHIGHKTGSTYRKL